MISCICPTYNRRHLLEEAIQCFLDQTHNDAELIILNDTPGQTLCLDLDDERITLINMSERFPTIAQKWNYLHRLAKGDWICQWDDDDIYFPNRLADNYQHIDKGCALIQPYGWLSLIYGKLGYDTNLHPAKGIYSGAFWRQAKPMPDHVLVGTDAWVFDQAKGDVYSYTVPPQQAQILYRWGMGHVHLSGHKEGNFFRIGQEPIDKGTFTLIPKYNDDYLKLKENYV